MQPVQPVQPAQRKRILSDTAVYASESNKAPVHGEVDKPGSGRGLGGTASASPRVERVVNVAGRDDAPRRQAQGLSLTYLGFSVVDWRLTTSSLVWVIAERLLHRKQHVSVFLRLKNGAFVGEGSAHGEPVFCHPLAKAFSFARARDGLGFAYITHSQDVDRFYCHAFQAASPEEVSGQGPS